LPRLAATLACCSTMRVTSASAGRARARVVTRYRSSTKAARYSLDAKRPCATAKASSCCAMEYTAGAKAPPCSQPSPCEMSWSAGHRHPTSSHQSRLKFRCTMPSRTWDEGWSDPTQLRQESSCRRASRWWRRHPSRSLRAASLPSSPSPLELAARTGKGSALRTAKRSAAGLSGAVATHYIVWCSRRRWNCWRTPHTGHDTLRRLVSRTLARPHADTRVQTFWRGPAAVF